VIYDIQKFLKKIQFKVSDTFHALGQAIDADPVKFAMGMLIAIMLLGIAGFVAG